VNTLMFLSGKKIHSTTKGHKGQHKVTQCEK